LSEFGREIGERRIEGWEEDRKKIGRKMGRR
jgi:hypothetical protein